jgi:CRISPR/Cas system-associated protein Cas5 (RAMP superfamily)
MYRHASESLIIHLARRSIEKFKELFPDEEPFIKILCLRDRRLISEYKSGKRNWRKIEVIGSDADVITLNDPVVEKTQKIKTVTRDFFKKNENVTNQVTRGKNTKRRAINERSKHIINVNEPDLTYIERVSEKEVYVDDLSIMLQTEIHTTELNSRYDFISLNKESLSLETFDTNLEANQSVLIKSTSTLSEALCEVKKTLLEFNSNADKLREKNIECDSMRKALKTLELSIQTHTDSEQKVMERVRKVLNTTETSFELAEKYVKLQEKLNLLKKNIKKYTSPEELHWDDLVKEKGYILAIQDLIHFWWDLSEGYSYSDYDSD